MPDMSSVTLVLYGRWPVSVGCSHQHAIFEEHVMLRNIFVSDYSKETALQHVLVDGGVISVPLRAARDVELIFLAEEAGEAMSIVPSLGDVCTKTSCCESYVQLLDAVGRPHENDKTLRVVLLPECPLEDTAVPSMRHRVAVSSANAAVLQALAVTAALDRTVQLRNAATQSGALFYALAYGACHYRRGAWTACDETVAFVPVEESTITVPTNVHTVAAAAVRVLGHENRTWPASIDDAHGVSVTIDERGDRGSCVCRVVREEQKFVVTWYFEAYDLTELQRIVARPWDKQVGWCVTDGGVQNYCTDQVWLASEDAAFLLAACRSAVQDMVERRVLKPILLPCRSATPVTSHIAARHGSASLASVAAALLDPDHASEQSQPSTDAQVAAAYNRATLLSPPLDDPDRATEKFLSSPGTSVVTACSETLRCALPLTSTACLVPGDASLAVATGEDAASSLVSTPEGLAAPEGLATPEKLAAPALVVSPDSNFLNELCQHVRNMHGVAAIQPLLDAVNSVRDNMPCTVFIGRNNRVHVLLGAFPPPVLVHVAASRTGSVLTANGDSLPVRHEHGSRHVHVGRILVELASYCGCGRVALYTAPDTPPPTPVATTRRRVQHRGAVHRFALRKELVLQYR